MKSNLPSHWKMLSGKSKTKLNSTKVFLAVGSTWLIVIFWLFFKQHAGLEACQTNSNSDIPTTPLVYTFVETNLTRHVLKKAIQVLPQRGDDEVEILLWNGATWSGFGRGSRTKLTLPNALNVEVPRECDIKCSFISDRSKAATADAILFDGTFYGYGTLNYLTSRSLVSLPQKRKHQRWINFAYETATMTPLLEESVWKENMDIDMSYRQNNSANSIPITRTCWYGPGTVEELLQPRPYHKEINPIYFFESVCKFGVNTVKLKFAEELMSFIGVDSYGSCLHNKDLPAFMRGVFDDEGATNVNRIELQKGYKFSLILENSWTPDYVTEKLMQAFEAGSVPIYWGAPNVDDWLPGEHSIIKVTDFNSAKELAEYIKMILNEEDEYEKFFDWKKNGLSPQFKEKFARCVFYNADCRLCKKIKAIRDQEIRTNELVVTHSMSFDGITSYIEIPHRPAYDVFAREYTIMTWFRYSQAGVVTRILDKQYVQLGTGLRLEINQDHRGNDRIRACPSDKCFLGETNVYPGHWYHVALVVSVTSGYAKIFLDGRTDALYNRTISFRRNSLPIKLGCAQTGASMLEGRLDDVIIFNKPLWASTIRHYMYNVLYPEQTEGLVGYWSFDEGLGDVATDGSAEKNHGLLYGGVQFRIENEKPVHVKPFDVFIKASGD